MTDPIRPIIRGQQVYLRTPERADVPLFVAWFNDADVLRHLEMRAPMSVAMEEAWFERMLAAEGKTEYHFVICLLADGRSTGTAGLHDIQERTGKAEFGIAIGEADEWGKGYGGDALNAICDFGFGELRLERIELRVYAENQRGRRAYLKAGFVHEGTLRRAHFARGQHQDVDVMSQLRDEWQALPRKRSWELSG